jgi:hypothetical protein
LYAFGAAHVTSQFPAFRPSYVLAIGAAVSCTYYTAERCSYCSTDWFSHDAAVQFSLRPADKQA